MSQRNNKPARTVVAALDRLEHLYEGASLALISALERYLKTDEKPSKETLAAGCYPLLRIVYHDGGRPTPTHRRAFGRLQRLGAYETTVTHPREFRSYLAEQLQPLATEYGARIEVERSQQRIPYPYVLDCADALAGAAVNVADLARRFPTPQLSAVGDEIADGAWDLREGEPRPLALFDAVRVDYSLQRLVHYTGSDWRHVQRWILLTNYHRYVDRFVRWAQERLDAGSPFRQLILPGNLIIAPGQALAEAHTVIAGSAWHRFQMPAYHLTAPDGEGVTLVNIGVGPSNAKTITDHLAVLRPNCWLMIGHCGGLRQTQQIGDYVLAHAYLRQDHILDDLVPPDIPIPALAEIQVALQDAAGMVTGDRGEALKRRLRTGTVVTNDDRNWELRFTQERRRINLSRAIAVDMESGTVAAQGYRLRVPYGTLLCVSDKPLHGEIKLPGAAGAFYERAVGQHLEIGLKALDLLRERRDTLHSRKLRSFDEPPFR
ncbi:MAG: AMP nucleosidase [Hyphomicrobiaceae bacterium]|nr:AMP nucleosidase [Hyphomicrobiaceae bacterium]